MIKQTVIAALALAALGTIPVAAQAQDAPPSLTVAVAGLDANSVAGAQILLRRITTAAEQVCGGAPASTLDRQVAFKPCVDEATQRTVAALHNPLLTALATKGAPAAKVAAR